MSKASIDHIEVEETAKVDVVLPSAADKSAFWRIFKTDPDPAFLADLARINETDLDEARVKRMERRIDWLIIPALAVCYMFYYVDKTTLSYAAIFGIKEDLKLKSAEYSWLSSVFYFGWLTWAVPTNLLMQKFPLGKYLAINIFLWGALLMAQAASRNFTDMMILRFLSGAFEATADPAFVMITALWYTREQQPVRIGLWYSANGIGIALGGLLGYGIGQISGALPSWKYEFLIIGAVCASWGIVLAIVLPDSPYYESKWFSYEDRLLILSRKRHDQGGADSRHWSGEQFMEALIDPKTYLFFLLGFSGNIPNGGVSNFGTLIISGFGFDRLQTSLMQIPYGAVVVVAILSAVYLNTIAPKNSRTLLMCLYIVPNIIGSCLMAWAPSDNKAARLVGYWLTGSYNAAFVLGLSLVSGNVGGQTKKAIANASIFLGVCAGNIVGPFLFKTSEAPKYTTGIIGMLVANCIEVLVILALRFLFLSSNRKRDNRLAEAHGGVSYDEAGGVVEDLTDWKNPAFRYVA